MITLHIFIPRPFKFHTFTYEEGSAHGDEKGVGIALYFIGLSIGISPID